jgi:hypothetical protein
MVSENTKETSEKTEINEANHTAIQKDQKNQHSIDLHINDKNE